MEASSTLADALLDDLDDLSDGGGEEEEHDEQPVESTSSEKGATRMEEDEGDGQKKPPASTSTSWIDSPALQNHLSLVQNSSTLKSGDKEDQAAEHELIVQSNQYLARLADELAAAHAQLRQAYNAKFPELEDILPNPILYLKTVRVIRNETDLTRVNAALNDFLTSQHIITISVTGSTTAGRQLDEAELQQLDRAADAVEAILRVQDQLTQFIESRLEGLAPSICALIGPTLAARLVSLAGGLSAFSKIPACNLQVLGQHVRSSTNKAAVNSKQQQHQGILAECDLVLRTPVALQRKVLKTVAAKLALAARFDMVNVEAGRQRSASAGQNFRRELEGKMEKWQEPDRAPTLKALPKPDLTTKKRRGGKRMRRLKERYEETAMMKQANTRAFSAQSGEYGDDAMGLTMGLLDTSAEVAAGNLRKTTEKRKMRQANTKASRKRAALMLKSSKANSTSGLASSMVFTPVQGMELVNPDATKEKVAAANAKWFADQAGFKSALPKK